MSIKCKAVLSNLSVGETPCYRLVPQDVTKIDEAEFLSRLATKAGQDTVQARYWLDTFRDDSGGGLHPAGRDARGRSATRRPLRNI